MTAGPRSRRGLIAVLAAMAAGWTGARLLTIALPWFVLSSTGSTTATGLVVFAQMGPYVIAQLLSGPIIDRVGPRRVSVAGDIAATVALAAVPMLYLADALSLAVLMLTIAVVGACDGPANAAKSVCIPAVTKAAGMRMERATGLSGAIERTATTVGPAIAGLVVALVGGVYALWITAVLTGLAAIIVGFGVSGFTVDAAEAAEPGGSRSRSSAGDTAGEPSGYLSQLKQGADFLRGEGLIRSIAVMVMATNLMDQAFMAVLLPVWIKANGYGPEAIGLVISLFGATSVLASLAAAAWGHRLPRRAVYLTGFIVGGIPRFAVMALGAPLWVIVAVFAAGGLGSGFINPIIGAVQYERIPQALLGRVSTLTKALAWVGIPFGGLAGSGVIAVVGMPGALLVVGGAYFLVTLLPGLRKEWTEMDSAEPLEKKSFERYASTRD